MKYKVFLFNDQTEEEITLNVFDDLNRADIYATRLYKFLNLDGTEDFILCIQPFKS